MKVLCTDHVDVAAPTEGVFAFVSDVSRWPVWFAPVVCAQHPRSLPVAEDEELVLCLHAGRKRWQETFEVTRFVRNAFLSLEGAFSAARRIDFRFERRGTTTRVACAMGYPLFGGYAARLLDSVFRRRRIRRELRDSLQRLKGLLEETVEPTSIDGDIFADIKHDAVSVPALAPDAADAATREPAGVR